MTISLSPELESFVNDKVNSGAYSSVTDIITDGLQKLREDEIVQSIPRDELQRKIQESLDSYARGEYTEYDATSIDSLTEKIIAEGRRRKVERAGQP